jgi:hypothetical protein
MRLIRAQLLEHRTCLQSLANRRCVHPDERPISVAGFAIPLSVSLADTAPRAEGRNDFPAAGRRDRRRNARELYRTFVRAAEEKIHPRMLAATSERGHDWQMLRVHRRIVSLFAERRARLRSAALGEGFRPMSNPATRR